MRLTGYSLAGKGLVLGFCEYSVELTGSVEAGISCPFIICHLFALINPLWHINNQCKINI